MHIPKGIQLTGPSREQLATHLRWNYERGATIRALATETGRSYGSIRRLLTESGTTMRPRGNHKNRKPRHTPILSRIPL